MSVRDLDERPRRWIRRLAVGSVALGVIASPGACKPKGHDALLPVALPAVTLPADDLAAAHAVGVAAATEKDPLKLAATLVAFLDRLHVPVISEKWDKLLATGPKPGPTSPWLWEPVLVGIARGTTSGHRMPFQQVMAGYLPSEDPKKIAKLDFADFIRQFAKAAAKQSMPVDGPLATAIAADLDQRKDLRSRPMLDPTASMLLGLLLVAEQNAHKSMPPRPAPSPSAHAAPQRIPGLPSNLPFTIPNIPNIPRTPPRTTHAFDAPGSGGAPPTVCSVMSAGLTFTAGAFSGSTTVGQQVVAYGGWGVPPALDQFMSDIAGALDGISMAGTITDGIAGMGIAAFVVTDGNVSPTSVAYGDGPATFTVTATSQSPFSKDQLNQFVDCLEAVAGTALGIDGLRSLPAAGPVSGLPVIWQGTSAIDPKHGTFTPAAASGSGIMGSLVALGMSAIGGGTTDAGGKAQATFQVKPKKGDQPANYTRQYPITAQVLPFPIGTSKVFAGANLGFYQSVPITFEIKVPFDSYQLTLTWSDRIQTPAPVYFQDDGSLTLKVTVNGGDLSIHGTGHGTHGYSMPTQDPTGPLVTCSAPVGSQPVDVTVDGKITDVDSMTAELHVKVNPSSNSAPMTIQCRASNGYTATRHANAVTGSVSSGTELESFTMTLGDGETKSVSMDKAAGPMEVTGTGNIVLAVDDSSGP